MVGVQIILPVTEVGQAIGAGERDGHGRVLVHELGDGVSCLARFPDRPAGRRGISTVRRLGDAPQILVGRAAAGPKPAMRLDVLLGVAEPFAVGREVLLEHLVDLVVGEFAEPSAVFIKVHDQGVRVHVLADLFEVAGLGVANPEAAAFIFREVGTVGSGLKAAAEAVGGGLGLPERHAVELDVGHGRDEVGGGGRALNDLQVPFVDMLAIIHEGVGRVEDPSHGVRGKVAPGKHPVGIEGVRAVAVHEDHGVVRSVRVRHALEVGRPCDAHHDLKAVIVGEEALAVHRHALVPDVLEEVGAVGDAHLHGLDRGVGHEVRLDESARLGREGHEFVARVEARAVGEAAAGRASLGKPAARSQGGVEVDHGLGAVVEDPRRL
mmetsp:Transcript_5995/g.14011  ORF Transcript_5995/g.14011 Transcript_5995/m.14011 type:complete len:380 (+) Transcript_5995:1094-2233(+)